MTCNCKSKINAKLAECNAELMSNLLSERHIFVATTKIDQKKRGKPRYLLASHCPFCGEKIVA